MIAVVIFNCFFPLKHFDPLLDQNLIPSDLVWSPCITLSLMNLTFEMLLPIYKSQLTGSQQFISSRNMVIWEFSILKRKSNLKQWIGICTKVSEKYEMPDMGAVYFHIYIRRMHIRSMGHAVNAHVARVTLDLCSETLFDQYDDVTGRMHTMDMVR